MQKKSTREIIIVGAGAAGLVAAISLARNNYQVTLLEQNNKIGKKILVSGNGRCNIDNKAIHPQRFHSQNPDFITQVLEGYPFEKVENFFTSIGLPLIEGKEHKMFPMTLQASSVVTLLEYEAKKEGVEILCECEVTSVSRVGELFSLESTLGHYQCEKLLLTSGSAAAPQLGGTEKGYHIAQKLGHTLIPHYPALVQLCSEESWVKGASGVKIAGLAKLYANGEYVTEKKGDLLFTNYGISGLAVLDLSREVSLSLAEYAYCELNLDLMPEFTKEKFSHFLLSRVQKESKKPLTLWLQGVLHQKLINPILAQSNCHVKSEDQLSRKEINKLVHAIKNLKLSINATRGLKYAEVATGGVNTEEINPVTMESKMVPHLYFAGEILDVDGDRGGFNFHFAWVTGMKIAEAMH